MFSLFQEKPPEDTPSDSTQETPRWRAMARQLRTLGGRASQRLRALAPAARHWNRSTVILGVFAFAALIFGIHEQRVAGRLQAQRGAPAARAVPAGEAGPLPVQQRSPEEERLAAQINVLNAKLDVMAHARSAAQPPGPPDRAGFARAGVEAPVKPAPTHVPARRPEASDVTVVHYPQQTKPDPRWQKVQDQLDAQGKQLDAQGKQIESTRQEISSTRSDLQSSIARTHEDLVALQRKGERNYYEFSLDKGKSFRTVGPVGVSLRKSNTKDQYADLKIIVDDREVSKKHLNLYEPVMFYPSGERQPVELVINSISKDHIRGYISASRYKASELQLGTKTSPPATSTAETGAARHKLVTSPR